MKWKNENHGKTRPQNRKLSHPLPTKSTGVGTRVGVSKHRGIRYMGLTRQQPSVLQAAFFFFTPLVGGPQQYKVLVSFLT